MNSDQLHKAKQDFRRKAICALGAGTPLFRAVIHVIEDQRFPVWAGSLDNKHHSHTGGLLKHVDEVWEFADAMRSRLDGLGLPEVPRDVLFTAVTFHDYGKLWDYMPVADRAGIVTPTPAEIAGWTGTTHKRLIHHISRSNVEWGKIAELEGVPPAQIDEVSHAILSHHGSRNYGSPVSPGTPVAWLLHLADMASARLDECARGVDHLTQRPPK